MTTLEMNTTESSTWDYLFTDLAGKYLRWLEKKSRGKKLSESTTVTVQTALPTSETIACIKKQHSMLRPRSVYNLTGCAKGSQNVWTCVHNVCNIES